MVIGKAPGGGDLVVGAVRVLEFTIATVVPFLPLHGNFSPNYDSGNNSIPLNTPERGMLTLKILNRGTEVQYHLRSLPKRQRLALATRNYQVWERLRFKKLALAGLQHVCYPLNSSAPLDNGKAGANKCL